MNILVQDDQQIVEKEQHFDDNLQEINEIDPVSEDVEANLVEKEQYFDDNLQEMSKIDPVLVNVEANLGVKAKVITLEPQESILIREDDGKEKSSSVSGEGNVENCVKGNDYVEEQGVMVKCKAKKCYSRDEMEAIRCVNAEEAKIMWDEIYVMMGTSVAKEYEELAASSKPKKQGGRGKKTDHITNKEEIGQPKKKGNAAIHEFQIGEEVEAQAEDDEFAWFPARIIGKKDDKYEIEYSHIFQDEQVRETRLVEMVSEETLRPLPPDDPFKYGRDCEVDYFVEEEGYWTQGVVCTVLPHSEGENSTYSVLNTSTFEEQTVEEVNIRTHFDFSEGKYQPSSLNQKFKERQVLKKKGLPKRKSWRYLSKPPQIQKPNTCYSFTSTAATETRWGDAHGLPVNEIPYLSAQQLIDCESSNGYLDGKAGDVLDFVSKKGLYTEVEYPLRKKIYKPSVHAHMKNAFEKVKKKKGPPKYKIVASMLVNFLQKDEVKEELAFGGVVISRIDAKDLEKCGAEEVWTSRRLEGEEIDDEDLHWVLLVGYDQEDDGTEYYLVKNSWGVKYHDKGYFKLKVGHCGVHDVMIYPLVKKAK